MKLVEIKNSLAKLYYEPLDFPLVLSDFLTIDDGNQKILAQVVSIESTSKEDTNCAVLKFCLDLDDTNKQSTYSGYVPALDSIVSKTKTKILNEIFSSAAKTLNAGVLTNSSKQALNLNISALNNFLYIQSDRQEETAKILNKITAYNSRESQKTLVIAFNNLIEFENANTVVLGKDLKLPVNNDILNYIYENDLTGLTVEQKTIVQDIILEIQQYIDTLEDGYIPFNTLLDVVNSVYESDKSTGVILLRNKLLKYKQFDIFASTPEEINALYVSLNSNIVTVLDISTTNTNWQKEALSFALANIDSDCYLIMDTDDSVVGEPILNTIYTTEEIKPIIASRYESANAAKLKSFAKNLILFKPEKQQKAAATYNAFLTKLAPSEFVVSGEATYYTPLIVQELPDEFTSSTKEETVIEKVQVIDEATNQAELSELLASDDDLTSFAEAEEITPLEQEEQSDIKNIFDESLEQEIAKDVDEIFTAQGETPIQELEPVSLEEETTDGINYDELISDDDLDILEEFSDTEESKEQSESELQTEQTSAQANYSDDDILIEDIDTPEEIQQLEDLKEDTGVLNDFEPVQLDMPSHEIQQENILQSLTENESLPGVPIYKTEPQQSVQSADGFNITEGNIVYHEKYGKGVVEELFNYGKRTLCSIQFDNVGRRLLDPNLAELKQM